MQDDQLLGDGIEVRPWHPSVVRARTTHIGFDVTAGAQRPDDDLHVPNQIRLRLFDDTQIDAELRAVRSGRSGISWVGRVVGEPDSEVVLSVVDGVYAGTVRSNGALYQLTTRRDGEQLVVELDEKAIPAEAEPLVADTPPDTRLAVVPAVSADDATVVDVLVVYSGAARDGAGSTAALEAQIELAVAETNLGFSESEVGINLRLVHTAEVTYSESHFDWSETLNRLRGQGDGFMDDVHALRDQVGADHVVMIVDTVGPYAGIGYQLSAPVSSLFDAFAFSVVARSYATGAYTFGHELGHNMGANHDHDNAHGGGFFDYSHGLQVPAGGFRTIMAYPCEGCVRVNRWSNPAVQMAGATTGVVDWADNARSLRGTAKLVAGFRDAPTTQPSQATMIEPQPGATLPAGPVTFSWTSVPNADYHLRIGDSLGEGTWFDASTADASSVTVEGLPQTGQPLSVRLWTLTQTAGWQFEDYVYTSYSEPTHAATVLRPIPQTTLFSTVVPFIWQDNGADSHRLQVGTVDDPSAFYDAELGSANWLYVPGLPHDGSAVVARLIAEGSQGPVVTTVQYTSYQAHHYATSISSPKSGATLDASATIMWSGNEDVTEYWLLLRNEDGSVISSDYITDTAVELSGLPTDGRTMLATLYALGVHGWAETSTVYRAAGH